MDGECGLEQLPSGIDQVKMPEVGQQCKDGIECTRIPLTFLKLQELCGKMGSLEVQRTGTAIKCYCQY